MSLTVGCDIKRGRQLNRSVEETGKKALLNLLLSNSDWEHVQGSKAALSEEWYERVHIARETDFTKIVLTVSLSEQVNKYQKVKTSPRDGEERNQHPNLLYYLKHPVFNQNLQDLQ